MLVGLSGAAGAGKSVAASYLHDRYGFTIISMADPMKRICADLFGFTQHQLYGPSSARSEPHARICRPGGEPLTARYALQTLGDWGKTCAPFVWLDAAMSLADKHDRVVIPDIRFMAEFVAVRQRYGHLIRRASTAPVTDTHASEREMLALRDDAFDAIIPHQPTLADLHARLDALMARWL
jgi:hypothetical protein